MAPTPCHTARPQMQHVKVQSLQKWPLQMARIAQLVEQKTSIPQWVGKMSTNSDSK